LREGVRRGGHAAGGTILIIGRTDHQQVRSEATQVPVDGHPVGAAGEVRHRDQRRGRARQRVAAGEADALEAEIEGEDELGVQRGARQAWPARVMTEATSTPSERQAAAQRSS
jgi:hypothetical protein